MHVSSVPLINVLHLLVHVYLFQLCHIRLEKLLWDWKILRDRECFDTVILTLIFWYGHPKIWYFDIIMLFWYFAVVRKLMLLSHIDILILGLCRSLVVHFMDLWVPECLGLWVFGPLNALGSLGLWMFWFFFV